MLFKYYIPVFQLNPIVLKYEKINVHRFDVQEATRVAHTNDTTNYVTHKTSFKSFIAVIIRSCKYFRRLLFASAFVLQIKESTDYARNVFLLKMHFRKVYLIITCIFIFARVHNCQHDQVHMMPTEFYFLLNNKYL